MPTVSFPSFVDAEVIEVDFLKLNGDTHTLRLLVDSGFSGRSSFVLPQHVSEVFRAEVPAVQTVGALQGTRNRAWVTCRIPALSYQATLIAICADTASLSLPPDVEGLAGLAFLRQFSRWGAERTDTGWQFFLAVDVG
jgi:hypothetical protein